MKASIVLRAHETAKFFVVVLYAMVVVSLTGSRRESVALAELAPVIVCIVALLCRFTRRYEPLQLGFVAACLLVVFI